MPSNPSIFDTTNLGGGVGNVEDEDIVTYDEGTDTWALYFDGSDVGIAGTDLNAFHVRSDGSILMSLDSATSTVPGLTGGPNGTTVEDSDVILFTGTTGPATSGSFSFHFDGNRVAYDFLNQFAAFSLVLNTSIPFPAYGGFGGLLEVSHNGHTGQWY